MKPWIERGRPRTATATPERTRSWSASAAEALYPDEGATGLAVTLGDD